MLFFVIPRSKLTVKAQDTALDVFADNFRRLLMTAPLRVSFNPSTTTQPDLVSSTSGAPGDRLPVVGLDPGWVHGCKWAACDPHGAILATGIMWPPIGTHHTLPRGRDQHDDGLTKLTSIMRTHRCVVEISSSI